MKKSLFRLVFFSLMAGGCLNLSSARAQSLTLDDFLFIVKENHPISKQAELLMLRGENEIRKSRGGFDPYLGASINQKYYDETAYYSLIGAGLKIPTWYGIEIEGGYGQNDGDFLNPENKLPNSGLWNAGVSVSLGKGLFIDERRAALRLAEIFSEYTEAEQQLILNDLYFKAIEQYWYWFQAWNQYRVLLEAVEVAEQRLEGIRQSFVFGDLPAIDTLEALIQVQQRITQMNNARLEYQKQSLKLSNYLWLPNNTPLEITESLNPAAIEERLDWEPVNRDSVAVLVSQLDETHPLMKINYTKLASFDIDRRMKVESLKPDLNLKYNLLLENRPETQNPVVNLDNYQWGLEFGIPIFLRKERADLKITQLKIQEAELELDQKLWELQNQLRDFYNQQQIFFEQLELIEDAVQNNLGLLEGERKKFLNGESSLFMINTREINYIEAQLKLNEIQTKYLISQAGFSWATGTLYLF